MKEEEEEEGVSGPSVNGKRSDGGEKMEEGKERE